MPEAIQHSGNRQQPFESPGPLAAGFALGPPLIELQGVWPWPAPFVAPEPGAEPLPPVAAPDVLAPVVAPADPDVAAPVVPPVPEPEAAPVAPALPPVPAPPAAPAEPPALCAKAAPEKVKARNKDPYLSNLDVISSSSEVEDRSNLGR